MNVETAETTSLVIINPPDTAEFERALTRKEKIIVEHFRPIKRAIDDSKRTVLDQERMHLEPVQRAKGVIRQTQMAYDRKERLKAEEEQRRVEAERRRAGERRLEQAKAAEEDGNTKTAEALLEAPIVTTTVNIEPPPTPKGQFTRKTWKARVVDMAALVAFVSANPALLHLIQPNEKALTAMAREQKDAMKIPGVETYSESSLTTRA